MILINLILYLAVRWKHCSIQVYTTISSGMFFRANKLSMFIYPKQSSLTAPCKITIALYCNPTVSLSLAVSHHWQTERHCRIAVTIQLVTMSSMEFITATTLLSADFSACSSFHFSVVLDIRFCEASTITATCLLSADFLICSTIKSSGIAISLRNYKPEWVHRMWILSPNPLQCDPTVITIMSEITSAKSSQITWVYIFVFNKTWTKT